MDQFSTVLPEDFNGTFYFTNASDEDFTALWGGKAYTYPAKKTTPMIIYNATPLEVQNIRKKFAKEYAEREFFKSERAKQMTAVERTNGVPSLNSIHQANVYSDNELKAYIQQCLEPLEIAKPIVQEVVKENIEDRLTRDEDGEINTQIAVKGRPLRLKDKDNKA